jgi:hypothetical protein
MMNCHPHHTKKPTISPAFSLDRLKCYLRFRLDFRAAFFAAAFLARVRAPLRAEALRWAFVLRPPLFLAALLRARFLAAAIFVSPR